MKKVTLTFLSLLLTVVAFGQEVKTASFWSDPFNHPLTPLFIVMTFIAVAMILICVVVFLTIKTLNTLVEQSLKEKAERTGVPYVAPESFWSRLTTRLNDSIPVEKEKDIDLGHNFDGIRELDNHLPPWWKWLFYATIAWSVIYVFVYHISPVLPLMHEEYNNEVAVAEEAKQKLLASQPQSVIDVEKLEYNADKEILTSGNKIFQSNCVACHRNDGGGNTIGPNLTDAYWLHGGGVKDVFKTVNGGFVEKGMPAWGKVLSPKDVRDVAFFVMSLQGTNPPNAKAPQGVLLEKSVTTQSDTTKTALLK